MSEWSEWQRSEKQFRKRIKKQWHERNMESLDLFAIKFVKLSDFQLRISHPYRDEDIAFCTRTGRWQVVRTTDNVSMKGNGLTSLLIHLGCKDEGI